MYKVLLLEYSFVLDLILLFCAVILITVSLDERLSSKFLNMAFPPVVISTVSEESGAYPHYHKQQYNFLDQNFPKLQIHPEINLLLEL